ncbi:MAG: energy-coupling factor ABC transporter ATP-binding protein [Deltaproteobacteria bacterium]|nr:energy-coupling factor ABC transporter ATP-binding protein [Deltaproteobacteria bacterium]
MIELKNVCYSYNGKTVLENISFRISRNERLVLLGVNGCGKTTLLKILNGLMFPQNGEYLFEGGEVSKAFLRDEDRRKRFRKSSVMLFQSPEVMLFNPTVYDEVAFGLRQILRDETEIRKKAEKTLGIFGLLRYRDSPPFELSGGEKQKLALASILAIEPQVLLLDEPMTNLDPKSQGEIIDLLYELEITTVISTHNLSMAPELGLRTILLSENHNILYDGNINGLLSDEDLLIRANLVHRHRHRHNGVDHTHYHRH